MSAVPAGSRPIDDPRVYLAAERTFLAWIRTSVSLMGFGFLIARFALFLREYGLTTGASAPARPGGLDLARVRHGCVGVFVCVLAAIRHRAYIQALEQRRRQPAARCQEHRSSWRPFWRWSVWRSPSTFSCFENEAAMQLGMIGLGRMGSNMVRRLLAQRPGVRRPRRPCRGGRSAGEGRGRRPRRASTSSWPSSSRRGRSG